MRHAARDARVEAGFRLVTLDVELDWDVVGFLARVTEILAEADVPVGALSAFSRDHLLIKQDDLGKALRVLGEHVAELLLRPRMKYDWKEKVVLITGASSGIGRALALELGKRGARLGLTARRAEELLKVAEEVERAGGEALALPADVRDAEAMQEAAARVREQLGRRLTCSSPTPG